jgi:hypothetical protein
MHTIQIFSQFYGYFIFPRIIPNKKGNDTFRGKQMINVGSTCFIIGIKCCEDCKLCKQINRIQLFNYIIVLGLHCDIYKSSYNIS